MSCANSVGPDQMPRLAASDLGLHCLPVPLLRDASHGRVTLLNFFQPIATSQTGVSGACVHNHAEMELLSEVDPV